MMKLVIFVGGTSRSGSTLLDMILANDRYGYSLGEIQALFKPTRRHHFQKRKELLSDKNWGKIINGGINNLYVNFFNLFPDINYVIDSSKNPFWVRKQQFQLDKNNIAYKNIIIYKKPIELASSFHKRGLLNIWHSTYINYHRKYFTLIKNFRSISYKDLVTKKESLIKLCDYLNITYFPEKIKYWEKDHRTLFGSNTAKVIKNYEEKHFETNDQNLKREDIQYDNPDVIYLEKVTEQIIDKYPVIVEILNELNLRNIQEEKYDDSNILEVSFIYSTFEIILFKMKYLFKNHYLRIFPEDYFNA